MLYLSLTLNLALVVLAGYLWLKRRDLAHDAERSSREFELMLQVHQAEQRTELLQAHALLGQARQQLSGTEAADDSPVEFEA